MENMNKLINRSKLLRHLLLVSVISLCSSLLLSPSLIHYFNLYFSSFASQILSHTIDKNCMFLLCNGLLVFLGITRSFSKSDPDHHHDRRVVVVDDDDPLEPCISIEDSSEVKVKEFMVDVEEEEEDDDDDDDEEEAEEEQESGVLGLDLKEEEEEWLENEEMLIEENVEEENWRLSTEQMNKKFEDFIRRMKEDLRIEAKQQIVMVYN